MTHTFSQNMVGAFNERKDFAFNRFFETYYPETLMRVKKRVGNLPGAEDLVSDMFFKMYRKKRQFATVRNIENYLGTMAVRMCNDFLKKHQRRTRKMDQVHGYYQRMEDRSQERADASNMVKAIHYKAIEMLPRQCREVYILSMIRELRNKEIAKLLNIAEKTVENQVNLAMRKLRKEFRSDSGTMQLLKLFIPILCAQLFTY